MVYKPSQQEIQKQAKCIASQTSGNCFQWLGKHLIQGDTRSPWKSMTAAFNKNSVIQLTIHANCWKPVLYY